MSGNAHGREAMSVKQIGDYELLEKIGRGGMGEVFKARHLHLRKIRALKVLPHHFLNDEQALARFRREVENCGRLEHPNIVQAHDAGEDNGVPFLVMEFVDGCNLDELVENSGRLSVGAACEVIRQAAVGLQHAHDFFLVHRDIKPSNLMLSRSRLVKILDLGLARLIAERQQVSRLTQDHRIMGSANYMAPEQWDDPRSVDIRADIYSLGCTLYFLLTGQEVFGGETVWAKQKAHKESPAPLLVQERPDVPAALQSVFEQMVAKNPEDRYATPSEVIEAIGPFASRQDLDLLLPVLSSSAASPPDTSGYLQKTAVGAGSTLPSTILTKPLLRRRKTLSFLGAAVVILGIIFLWPGAAKPLPDLAGMPGLHGDWWFEEVPWFAPSVRAQLLDNPDRDERLSGGLVEQSRSSNVSSFYSNLKSIVGDLGESLSGDEQKCLSQLRALASMRQNEDFYLDGLGKLAEEMKAIEHPSATTLHTLAVIQHKLRAWDDAEESYLEAMKLYEQDDRCILHCLCAVDYARMLLKRGNGGGCISWCGHERMEKESISPALRIVAYCLEAEAYRNSDLPNKALETLNQAEKVTGLSDDHPLKAHIIERRAWAEMDSWKLGQAVKSFQRSLDIRRKADQGKEDSATLKFVLWSRQGIAMANHLLGNHDIASKEYEALRREVPDARGSLSRDERRRAERGPNALERLAECYLFGPKPDYNKAATLLQKGIQQALYLDFHHDERAPYILRLYYKRILASALSARTENEGGAEKSDLDVQELIARLSGPERPERKHFAFAQEVASGVIDLRSRVADRQRNGVKTLMDVVRRKNESAWGNEAEKKVTRKNIELLLLAIEQLYKSERLSQTELVSVTRELNKVAGIACQGKNHGAIKYLRRYEAAAEHELKRSLAKTPNQELDEELETIQNRLSQM